MPGIFTRIVNGEIPCHKVGEDERFLAFLDINPLREGHTLVIPKIEVDNFFDLPVDTLRDIMPFAQGVARRIARVVPCDRIGVSVVGLEVPHAHVAMKTMDGAVVGFFSLEMSAEQLAAIAERIRNA